MLLVLLCDSHWVAAFEVGLEIQETFCQGLLCQHQGCWWIPSRVSDMNTCWLLCKYAHLRTTTVGWFPLSCNSWGWTWTRYKRIFCQGLLHLHHCAVDIHWLTCKLMDTCAQLVLLGDSHWFFKIGAWTWIYNDIAARVYWVYLRGCWWHYS